MENFIGNSKNRTEDYPVHEPIEIRTEGGFTEFYVTAIHRVLDLSLILYSEVLMIKIKTFFKNLVSDALDALRSYQIYWISVFNFPFPKIFNMDILMIFLKNNYTI